MRTKTSPEGWRLIAEVLCTVAHDGNEQELITFVQALVDDGYAEGQRDALEAAAKVCDEVRLATESTHDAGAEGYGWEAANKCGERIRELKP